jgi:hypothetical protein
MAIDQMPIIRNTHFSALIRPNCTVVPRFCKVKAALESLGAEKVGTGLDWATQRLLAESIADWNVLAP